MDYNLPNNVVDWRKMVRERADRFMLKFLLSL